MPAALHTIAKLTLPLMLLLTAPFMVSAAEIAATLPPLAGLVKMLDNKAEVMCLLPTGADPHHFQMQPRTIEKLAKSRLLIRSSFDDGGWPLPPNHENVLDIWPDKDHGWVSPKEVRLILPHIANALIKLDPQQEVSLNSNLNKAIAITFAIEKQWQKALEQVRSSGVIMQHPSWRRLMVDMQVPVLNVLESGHHGHEHGPHALDDSLHQLEEHPGAWLISDAGHTNRALDWLRQHSYQAPHHITLDALADCNTSWDQLMLQNLQQVSEQQ
ncbi:ABC-type Zn uptake system ZnuABC, Zn-binding component ZnuA [Mariprofundus aestuarium]|uniref:ABC-type Zn uptake system ZnuABC, Zn-binding component ZnuA n=1 Tax=Mariprofundus aestuarium TaxID=1921086 RepID=A0A2K8L0I5_MARES|nr:zinc ABC transporter substrate-binding protein [Mariprofundus aestuarium]ATX80562.1 ABC-type Zn uptake system ZnuABC, Zn-binding component ZnuA [Mariprofundus aestuarium]